MNSLSRKSAILGEAASVAVVGIGCRYPGGVTGPESYWSLVMKGETGIRDIPADRWDASIFYSPEPDTRGKMRSRWGGFLATDVFAFDPQFFDMSPREAISMDPQQRLLLQVAYEAVQDAGLRIRDLQAGKTGVFIGMSTNDYAQRQLGSKTDIFAATGTAFSIASNRLSHRFDLHGPSMTIDTACSSSLVAIDRAVNSILSGDCSMALAGGVNCMFDPHPYIAFTTGNMLSPTGAIYTFDSRANGFVRGEGCGLVLLKPLARAVADGDRIYGVVRQTAVNQDGHTETLTSPSGTAQEAMLRELSSRGGIDPRDVGYIEAHGTGTPVGDPIEATAIGRVFGDGREAPALVGSSKPNIGHLESGAGAAGFIKALLTVYNGTVPPNRNFDTPNPGIPFDALGLRVPTAASAFPAQAGRPRLAVVNSFGFGGTNASALIEEWRAVPHSAPRAVAAAAATSARPVVVPLSAGGKKGLGLWAERLSQDIAGGALAGESAEALARTLWRRDAFAERAALLVRPETDDLTIALKALAEGEALDRAPAGPAVVTGRSAAKPRLAYAFSGQGGQWWGMGRRLLTDEPLYRRTVETISEELRPLTGLSLIDELLCDEATSRIGEAPQTLGGLFSNQVALFELWNARGLVPELLVGHSFGEVALAHVSGMIDLPTAARIIAARGNIPRNSPRRGAMAAIGLTAEQLEPFLPADGSVVIAAFNGPASQTVSGVEQAVLDLMKAVSEQHPGALVRRVATNFAWHSPLLDDCEAQFRAEIGTFSWRSPAIPVVSTVTGGLIGKFDLEYLWDNLRQPVSFTRAVRFCLDYGINAFLEIGPHRTLVPLMRGIAQDAGTPATIATSLERNGDDFWTLARAEATLFTQGIDLPEPPATDVAATDWQKLPKMPWSNQHLEAISPQAKDMLFEAPRHVLLGKRDPGPDPRWTSEILLPNLKFLNDHRVNGDCLFPAVGYLEVMAAALRDHFGHGPVEIRDFRIHEALSLAPDDIVEMRTDLDPRSGRLRIHTLHQGAGDGWRLRADGYGWRHDFVLPRRPEAAAAPDDLRSIDKGFFYKVTRRVGLEYGRQFQPVQRVWNTGGATMRARLLREADTVMEGYFAFPGLFDGIVQASTVAVSDGFWDIENPDDMKGAEIRLPVGARRVLLARPLSHEVWAEARPAAGTGPDLAFDFEAYDTAGELLIAVETLQTRALGSLSKKEEASGDIFTESFVKVTPPAAATPPRRNWLLIADDDATAATLGSALASRGVAVERADDGLVRGFEPQAIAERLSAFCRSAPAGAGIVVALDGGARALAADAPGTELLAATQAITEGLVAIAQGLQGMAAGMARPKLVLVSEMARHLPGDPAMDLASVARSAAVGLMRTIANELSEVPTLMIDADAASLGSEGLAQLIIAEGPEPEYLLRAGECLAVRLEKTELPALTPAQRKLLLADPRENFRVTMSSPGVIDNIRLREASIPEPGPEDVMVEVAAVGLNFRDVMAATSILPDELPGEAAYWNNLGLEFAGTVRQVGSAVTGLKAGDRVMGMGRGFLRRYALVRAESLMRVPDHIALDDAASMPVAYLTAHYALLQVGRLEPGERALIHLASGGVGLAAINVCRHVGAEIFATAGTGDKRSYLRDLGITHIMNSRGLDFAREVKAATGGEGVDVVLNALSGAGIDKSLECLAPLGRMVEIGKRDLADDKPIGLKSLYWNNSYSVVDLSTLYQARPRVMLRLLADVEALIASGAYTPLRSERFPVTKAAEAMRTLAKARHIGKVVVTLSEPELTVEQDLTRPIRFRADASYLVTGGLKGFGAQIGSWIGANGAGKLILANRAGKPDESAAALIHAMEAQGTIVECAAVDVMDASAVAALVAKHAQGPHPLRGIFHAAAVIEDAFITQLDRNRIARVLGPKVAGAQNLENAVRKAGISLDHAVYFSSVAQLLGSAGQANYTAANSVLNAFANYRLSHSGSANAVAWGMIGGSGFVSRSEALGNYLESMGIKAVADTEAANALGSLMRSTATYAAFAKVDWPAVARAFPAIGSNPRIQPVLERAEGGRSRIQAELMGLPRAEWEGVLDQLIRAEVARVLKADTAAVAVDKKLTELGLDSLSSFELKNRIEALVEVSIPVARFLQAPTISGLSKLVASSFEAKLKASELAARSGAAGSEAAGGPAGQGYRPLARQLEALRRARLAMTSPLAAADLVITAEAMVSVTREFLAGRLRRLGELHESLRLAAVAREDGTLDVVLGDVPELAAEGEGGELPLPGPLWRVEASQQEDELLRVVVRAHRAAADGVSVHEVLGQLAGTDELPASAPRLSEALPLLERGEESSARINDLAYWREILARAPEELAISQRGRVAAPAGFGVNRGKLRILRARLANVPADAWSEAVLLGAYAAALGKLTGRNELLIERHGRSRPADLAGLVGPLATSHPVLMHAGGGSTHAAGQLAALERHAPTDLATIEAVLGEQLRQRKVTLRQFGFAVISEEAVPLTANEMLLLIDRKDEDAQVVVAIDSEVFPDGSEARLAELFTAELAALAQSPDARPSLSGVQIDERQDVAEGHRQPMPTPRVATSDQVILPLTINQSAALSLLTHPDVREGILSSIVVSRAFKLTPQVDLARLSACFNELRQRHEAMRTRFIRKDDGTFQALLVTKAKPAQVIVEQYSDHETAEKRVAYLSDAPIDPFEDDLFQVHVIRLGSDSDLLVVRGHHLLLDGYSVGLLVEEMVQLFLGMSLPPVEITTEEFVREIDLSHDLEALRHRDDLLARVYARPLPQRPALYRSSYVTPAVAEASPCQNLVARPSAEQLAALRARCSAAGVTLYTMLAAAYGAALGGKGAVDDLVLNITVSRRHDRRLRNFVNWVMADCPVRLHSQSASLQQSARHIGSEIDSFLSCAPVADAYYEGAFREELLRGNSYVDTFMVGMFTSYRSSGSSLFSQILRKSGLGGEIDLGLAKLTPLSITDFKRVLHYDLDVRLFETLEGQAISFTYKTDAIDPGTARGLFEDMLGRLGLSGARIA